jgi:hypothetical protein
LQVIKLCTVSTENSVLLNVTTAISNIACTDRNRMAVMDNRGSEPLIRLLRQGTLGSNNNAIPIKLRLHAVRALANLTFNPECAEEIKVLVWYGCSHLV